MKNIFIKENLSHEEIGLLLDSILYYKNRLLLKCFKDELKSGKVFDRPQIEFLNKIINELTQ